MHDESAPNPSEENTGFMPLQFLDAPVPSCLSWHRSGAKLNYKKGCNSIRLSFRSLLRETQISKRLRSTEQQC